MSVAKTQTIDPAKNVTPKMVEYHVASSDKSQSNEKNVRVVAKSMSATGANCCAALQIAKRLGRGNVVVTVFCDTGERYLTTDLFQAEGI